MDIRSSYAAGERDFSGANLSDANLSDANLRGAVLMTVIAGSKL